MVSHGDDEPERHYESVSRLADKTAVNHSKHMGLLLQLIVAEGSLILVCDVLGLDRDVITNHDPLPEPQRLGAGGVRKFANGR